MIKAYEGEILDQSRGPVNCVSAFASRPASEIGVVSNFPEGGYSCEKIENLVQPVIGSCFQSHTIKNVGADLFRDWLRQIH